MPARTGCTSPQCRRLTYHGDMRRNIALGFVPALLLTLAACGGGSSNTAVPLDKGALQSAHGGSVPQATPTPNSKKTVNVGKGQINGLDNQFLGGQGAEAGDGDYSDGGQGPVNTYFTGPTGDQIPCLPHMYGGPYQYHIHAFLGIYYNGKQIAVPDGLGMADPNGDGTWNGPGGPIYNFTNYSYDPNDPSKPGCFYEIHSHDASGAIHIEMYNPNGIKRTASIFTMGDLLALWGVPYNISAGQFGPYSGPIKIYWSGARPFGGPSGSHTTTSNYYTLYTGNIQDIPLYSHQVTWILIGSGNPTGSWLPNVHFWQGEMW